MSYKMVSKKVLTVVFPEEIPQLDIDITINLLNSLIQVFSEATFDQCAMAMGMFISGSCELSDELSECTPEFVLAYMRSVIDLQDHKDKEE